MINMTDKDDKTVYCDLCCMQPNGELLWNENSQIAIIDGPTRLGAWAYMCDRHVVSSGYPNSLMNSPVNTKRFTTV